VIPRLLLTLARLWRRELRQRPAQSLITEADEKCPILLVRNSPRALLKFKVPSRKTYHRN